MLSLPQTRACSLSLKLAHALSPPFSHKMTHAFSFFLSLSQNDACFSMELAHALSLSLSHSFEISLSLSLSQNSRLLSLSLSKLTHTLSVSLKITHEQLSSPVQPPTIPTPDSVRACAAAVISTRSLSDNPESSSRMRKCRHQHPQLSI